MKFINKIAGVTLLLFSFFSCDINNSGKDNDAMVSLSIAGQQGDIKVVPKDAGQIFMSISSDRNWQVSIEDKNRSSVSWLSVDEFSGSPVESKGLVISYTENKGAERTAFIILSNTIKADTIVFTQQGVKINDGNNGSDGNSSGENPDDNDGGGNSDHTGETPKEPEVPEGEHIHGDVTLIETPRLAGGTNNWYVSYRLRDGSVNYSLEWDNNWKLPRWVCFTFDRTNKGGHVGRTNAWGWDGIITPAKEISRNWYPGGYDRGHMVASSDRQITREANEQTFYYTNMTPQLSGLNQQFWNEMEQWVQDRARSSFNPDVMYVVKGVAFDDGKPSKWSHGGQIAIPDAYYMAVVIKKNGKYNGLGMWVDHIPISRRDKDVSDVAMTIDEVEKRAGVDLFHNLPDDIENKVESENPRSGFWPGIR